MEGALYGLQESPKSWGVSRDGKLKTLSWLCGGKRVALKQCQSDVSLWLITCEAVTVGTLGVYVDDLLVMSEKGHLDAALAALQSLWQTSKPEYISQKGGLCFCGLQIEQVEDVIKIHQRTYLCELRDRYPELVPKAALPEFRGEPLDEQPCPEAIHAAQRIIGELTWVAGRTRPDIAFHVNRISRMTARYPSQALGLGKHVLQYLLATIDFAICYCPTPVVPKSMLDELPVHPAPDVFQIWADASFAQADARSQTGVMITLNLQPLAWISVQQPYVALSTCESELVASTEGMSLGQALEPLISELTGLNLRVGLFSDNVACAAILTFPGGSWRTRHLRLRSHAIRERVDEGSLDVMHIPGPYMLGDCLTKTLPMSRLCSLLQYMGCTGISAVSHAKEDKVELKSLYIPGGPLLFKLLVCAIIQPVSAQGRDPVWFGVWVWLSGVIGFILGLSLALWVWYESAKARWKRIRLLHLAQQVAQEEPAYLFVGPTCSSWSPPPEVGPPIRGVGPEPVSFPLAGPNPSPLVAVDPEPVSSSIASPNPSELETVGPEPVFHQVASAHLSLLGEVGSEPLQMTQGVLTQDVQSDSTTISQGACLAGIWPPLTPDFDSAMFSVSHQTLWEYLDHLGLSFLHEFLVGLGVETVADLRYLYEEDLLELGMNQVDARRILRPFHPEGHRRPEGPWPPGSRGCEVPLLIQGGRLLYAGVRGRRVILDQPQSQARLPAPECSQAAPPKSSPMHPLHQHSSGGSPGVQSSASSWIPPRRIRSKQYLISVSQPSSSSSTPLGFRPEIGVPKQTPPEPPRLGLRPEIGVPKQPPLEPPILGFSPEPRQCSGQPRNGECRPEP